MITEPGKIDTYYDALLERNASYVGIFFVGVRTTSIFCLPTCRARKPLKTNVEFFPSVKEALDHGYRPCKICRPTENAHEAPEMVQRAIQLIAEHPKQKISDYNLRQEQISPAFVRRWFKKHYGITFQAYQRMYRINNAYQELKGGKRTTDSAFDAGYDSLSGFGYTYKKLVGAPPSDRRHKIMNLSRLTSPLGPMFIGATDRGVCLLEFVDRRMLETEFKDLQRTLKVRIVNGENEHITQAKKELKEYFEGNRQEFTVALDTPGTEFQLAAWRALHAVHYGQTVSYQHQATVLGNPKAVRAAARANGANRVSIIIPCHRIIGKDGNLTGYGGGLERKRWLLDHERNNLAKKAP